MKPPKTIHPDITFERVEQAIKDSFSSLDNPGFCNACGEDAEGCEPDARHYKCECCGKHQVFGAEEYIFMMEKFA